MKRKGLLVLVPSLLLVTVFLLIPLILVMIPSFYDGGFTLNHYISFLSDPFFGKIMMRTIRISLVVTVVCVLFGIPTAYFISVQKPFVKRLLNALVLFPLLTNSVIRGFAWMTILGKNGILNSVLLKLGLIQVPLSMMYTEFAIVVGSVYLFLPLMITTLVSVMDQIEDDIVLASSSLGAKPISVFMKTIIPLSFSGILLGSVLVFTGTMSAYTTPSLLGGNKNMMLTTLLYQQANQLSNWTQAGLISLIMVVLSVVLMKLMTLLSKKVDKRGNSHA